MSWRAFWTACLKGLRVLVVDILILIDSIYRAVVMTWVATWCFQWIPSVTHVLIIPEVIGVYLLASYTNLHSISQVFFAEKELIVWISISDFTYWACLLVSCNQVTDIFSPKEWLSADMSGCMFFGPTCCREQNAADADGKEDGSAD